VPRRRHLFDGSANAAGSRECSGPVAALRAAIAPGDLRALPPPESASEIKIGQRPASTPFGVPRGATVLPSTELVIG
jgi:hypothetical protein